MNPQPEPVKRTEVLSRLNTMGLTESGLQEAVRSGYQAAATVTANDPVGYWGTTTWAKIVRALREWLLPLGFSREDRENVPLVVHPDRSFVLTVAPGTSATGTDRTPMTRNPKGPATERAIHTNQACFTASDHPAFARPASDDPKVETWLLLHFLDREANEVRLELSLPAEISAGRVTGWRERLILAPVSFGDEIPIDEDEDEDDIGDIDINISRR